MKAPGFWKNLFFSFTALVFGVTLALFVVENVLRLDFFLPRFEISGLTVVLHPQLLYRMQPYSRQDINRYGYRGEDRSMKKSPNVKRIVFLGDSFVFGSNVALADSLPTVLEKALGEGFEVLNFGVIGYGPDQSLVQWMKEGWRWKPDLVILGVYPANDFADIEKNRIFELGPGNTLKVTSQNAVSRALPKSKISYWFQLFARRFRYEPRMDWEGEWYDPFDPESYHRLFEKLFGDYYDFDFIDAPDSSMVRKKIVLMEKIIECFRDLLAAKGIPFWVVIFPSIENVQDHQLFESMGIPSERYFANEDTMMAICRRTDVRCLNLYPEFLKERNIRFFQPTDGHLSVEGYRYVAQRLAEEILPGLRES